MWVLDFAERAVNVLGDGFKLAVDSNDKAECLKYIGFSLYDLEKYQEAINTFNKSLSLAKDRYLIASAYDGLGQVCQATDEWEKAIAHSKKSLKYYDINNEEQIYGYYLNFTRIISCYLLLKKKDEADKYINDILTRKDVENWAISDV